MTVLQRVAWLAAMGGAACTPGREPASAPSEPEPPAPRRVEAGAPSPPVDASSDEPAARAAAPRPCSPEMTLVGGDLCIDRYEMSIIDAKSERPLSPYFPVRDGYRWYLHVRAKEAAKIMSGRDAGVSGSFDFPDIPEWQLAGGLEPMAVSRAGVVPHGYLTMPVAKSACERAGKRLCKLDEWRRACRGEADEKFPYGPRYRRSGCNLARGRHPGRILFGDPSASMIDPRLNLMTLDGEPLLRKTGATAACASRWGDAAAYDMVGNLAEWVDDPKGALVGGSYPRYIQAGCQMIIRAHPPGYWDYSTGARCCRDATPPGG